MTKEFNVDDLIQFQNELRQVTDRLATLEVTIVNKIGKTRARKFWNRIKDGRTQILNSRYELENIQMALERYGEIDHDNNLS